jgi:hypothetical protein
MSLARVDAPKGLFWLHHEWELVNIAATRSYQTSTMVTAGWIVMIVLDYAFVSLVFTNPQRFLAINVTT